MGTSDWRRSLDVTLTKAISCLAKTTLPVVPVPTLSLRGSGRILRAIGSAGSSVRTGTVQRSTMVSASSRRRPRTPSAVVTLSVSGDQFTWEQNMWSGSVPSFLADFVLRFDPHDFVDV